MASGLDLGDVQEDQVGRDLAAPKLGPDSDYAKQGAQDAENFANDPANASKQGPDAGDAAKVAAAAATGGVAGAARAVASFAGNNKKGIGIAGGLGGLIVVLILGFMALVPLKLFDMEKNLFNHNFGVEQNTEKKLMKKLIFRSNPLSADGTRKFTGKGFFGNKWANYQAGKFEDRLATKGIKFEYDAKSNLIGITRDGVTQDLSKASVTERAGAVIKVVNDEYPPWQIAKRVKFIKLMTIRYGVSFRFWKSEKISNFTEYLKERASSIRNGASTSEIAAAEALDRNSTTTDPNGKPISASTATQEAGGSALVKDVQAEFAKTSSITDAVKVGLDAVKNDPRIGAAGFIALICGVKQIADEAVQQGYDTRAEELMRMGGALLSAASQLRNGQGVDSKTLNYLMLQYEADRNAKPAVVKTSDTNQSITVTNEDSLDFTQAAAWRRATNQPVNNANPEMNPAANPDSQTGLGSVIAIVDNFAQATGAAGLCTIVNSVAGQIFIGVATVVELAANIFDMGAEEIATTLAKFAAQAVLVTKVLPDLLAGAAGLAITGTENAVQMISFNDAGMALMSNDYGRSFGSAPISDATYTTLAAETRQSDLADAQSKGLAYNLFSPDNTDSLTSKLIIAAPSSPKQAVASLYGAITTLPNMLRTGILSLIGRSNAAVTVDDNPNKFQRTGFTDAELNKYTVDELANYFENQVATVNGQPVNRLSALGDPQDFSWGSQDTNTNDAFHCFVNSFQEPGNDPDPICLNIGYLTQDAYHPGPGEPAVVDEAAFQRTLQANVYDVYCQANLSGQACPFTAAPDEMLRYRLYLAYQHIAQPLYELTQPDSSTTSSTPAPATTSSYQDPLRDATGVTSDQVDAGVDYTANVGAPVHPIGNAVILKVVRAGAGWSGSCCFTSYKLVDGAAQNLTVFVAENCKAPAGLAVGQTVTASAVLCNIVDQRFIETGWATASGNTSAASGTPPACYRGLADNRPDSWGVNFNNFLKSYGFKSGNPASLSKGIISCQLPSTYSAWN